uniref:Restriction endonuclease n=1 Tax=viral metagenome TaxID=1070528 RepID=A0A6C0IH60_9ZZZZ
MSYLLQHLTFLEQRMRTIRHLPSAFEYYAAKQMTLFHKIPFYVYQDISPVQKQRFGFPLQDKGVDLADEHFTHIAQVKYYGHGKMIHYGALSTFLGTPILVGKRNLPMTLIRTRHSVLHPELQNIVDRRDITDFKLCSTEFLGEIL